MNTCSEPWILLTFANQLKPELIEAEFDNTIAVDAFQDYLYKQTRFDFKRNLKEFLLQIYRPLKGNYKFIIDKTPRYWEIIEEVYELFPEAKFIILKRNPIDVAQSMVRTWAIPTIERLLPFRRDLLIAPKKLNDFILLNGSRDNVYTLRYEDLVNDEKTTVNNLYSWLGIGYNDQIFKLGENKKIKGKYGDPFQNNDGASLKSKQKADAFEIPEELNRLIMGYGNYLGKSFLDSYGGYAVEISEYTREFNEYLKRPFTRKQLKASIVDLKNSNSYKLGSFLLSPFRWFKGK